ncbi:hypothetical protein KKF91_11430 [Myxococcota bacterium]|nr:hypothetical protein [Myxococcota bacterium]MBU1431139.1 hypothetical protein [Myxococcota bacterium]MBU1899773.1 hypothetical protein [Myxococcota bacterium]
MSDPVIYDKRLVQQNFRRGRLTPAQLEAHLEALPDVSAKSTRFTLKPPHEESPAVRR